MTPDRIHFTPVDREVLHVLTCGMILTPSVIAKNTQTTRGSVHRALNKFRAAGIVEKIDRGHYQLTPEARP
jgi:DNA-binding IclR family transcriptional regulator